VRWKRVVEFVRQSAEFRESGPWDRGKVVVLIMVPDLSLVSLQPLGGAVEAYIIAEQVKPAIVTGRLLRQGLHRTILRRERTRHEVMLGNEMRCTRVEGSSKEAGHQEINQSSPAEKVNEEGVERQDSDEVVSMPYGWLLSSDEPRSQCVKEKLECPEAVSMWARERDTSTDAKNVLPATLFSIKASRRLGKSVSIPSSPRNL
jgi:hypothetical protein